jgi:hypothetical protein
MRGIYGVSSSVGEDQRIAFDRKPFALLALPVMLKSVCRLDGQADAAAALWGFRRFEGLPSMPCNENPLDVQHSVS